MTVGGPTPLQVRSQTALQVDLLSGSMTVKVVSGDTIYYADQPYVNATDNQGSIALNASATFTTPVWLKSAGLSAVTVTQLLTPGQDIVLGSDGMVGGPGGTALTSTVPFTTSANLFSDTQTFKRAGTQITTKDANGNSLLLLQNIAPTTHNAGAVQLFGENGLGTGASTGAAWQFGVDTAASTPYQDFFLSKWLASNGVSDPNGIYISNGGASEPSGVGIGVAQPNDTGSLFRLKVQSSGSALTVDADAAQGALQLLFASGQTGDMLQVGSSNDATTAFRVRPDGTILAHAATTADVSVADAVTNATTTVTSATAAFDSSMLGKYVTGTNIPAGSYISAVNSASSITIAPSVASGSGSGGTLTMLGRAYQFRSNGNIPYFTVASNGSGGQALLTALTGLGVGAVSGVPGGVFHGATTGSSICALKLQNITQGSLIAQMAGSGNVAQIWTSNASGLQLGINTTKKIEIGSTGNIGFFGVTPAAQQSITGALSTVTDAAAKAVLTSIITALTNLGLATNGTT